MRKPVTEEDRIKILDHFESGNGITHIAFLMDYAYDGGDLNGVVREQIADLKSQLAEARRKAFEDAAKIADKTIGSAKHVAEALRREAEK